MKRAWAGIRGTGGRNTMMIWLAAESVIIVVASVMTFLTLEFISNTFYDSEMDNNLFSLGMIVPMGSVVGVANYCFNRGFQHHVRGLTEGLRAVAGGEFDVQLEVTVDNPLDEAYENFNKMARELEGVQLLRKDFINSFSHEFKTPITAIQGFAELLQEPGIPEEERRQYLQIISEEAARLAELSSNTLFLSRLESQQFILEKEPFLLDEQIKRCAILLSHQWEEKEISFSADLQDGVTYNGNMEMMRHVWLNLLGNAIKYTPEGGEITVSMRADGDTVTVSVADTGIGMTEEVRARVFDKYFQGDPSRANKGLGLGLSIVHRIVELCGGEIRVESVYGQGSVFTVCLPT